MALWISVLLTTLMGCTGPAVVLPPTCSLEANLEVAPVSVGQTVSAAVSPVSEVWDTSVRVGGEDAVVRSVDRVECEACDLCVQAAACDVCGDCLDCQISCATCVEAVGFEVPAGVAGVVDVVITNQYGSSDALTLTVQ